MTEPKSLQEIFQYNATANELDLAEAEKRLDSLLERRTKISERSTFGLLALNGASAAAAFSAIQSNAETLEVLKIPAFSLAYSISAFLLGMILAVIGVWFEALHVTKTAGKQFLRTSALRNVKKALGAKPDPDSIARLGNEIEQIPTVPPTDFLFSKVHVGLQNFSGGAWLAGVGYVLWQLGKQINWCA